jgi:WD40 repeat protein
MRRRSFLAVVALLILIGVGVTMLIHHRHGSSDVSDAAERARVIAPSLTAGESGRAPLLALAADRLQPSLPAQLAMLEVAIEGQGIERVLQTGAKNVTAAIRLEHLILTAGDDDLLKVWRPAGGALLGEVTTPRPLTTIGEAAGLPLAAGADLTGMVTLIDVSEPHHPRLLPLPRSAGDGPVLAIGFSQAGREVLVARKDGELERFATRGGRRLGARSMTSGLRGLTGYALGHLVAAQFEVEPEGPPHQLLLGFADGTVASETIAGHTARLLLPPGKAPGRITSLARYPYGEIAIGTQRGVVILEGPNAEPTVESGPAVHGVAFILEEQLLTAEADGIRRRDQFSEASSAAGRPAVGLSAGRGGPLALDAGGAVSVLGTLESGLSLEQPNYYSPAISFLPGGGLVLAEGWAANHIERLVAVRPGHRRTEGAMDFEPQIRTYDPASSWWPEPDESESGLYVNDIASDSEFVVAGGQDPSGEAVVLVWDARTGKPVRRLPLSTGALDTNEPSIIADVALIPGRHLLAAYSAAQQLVAIWSTDDWKLLASVPVGPAGDLQVDPSESQLLAVGVPEGDREEELGTGKGASTLYFIDSHSMRIDHEVRTGEVSRAAFSPDGSELALLGDDGMLRLVSTDGRTEERQPIRLEGQPLGLAWRPDGKLIAVSLNEGGVELVDPTNGTVSSPLPGQESTNFDLAWSGDGRFLVATSARQSEEGEFFEPGPTEIWALDSARLQRRMCELSGDPIAAADWRRLVDPHLPYRPLCRTRRSPGPGAPRGNRVVIGAMAFAPNGLGWGRERPEQIFNGGDPSGYVSNIHWSQWGGREALGFGENMIFKPQGGYFARPAKIELRATDIGHCGLQRAYTKLSVRVPRTPGGPLGRWGLWSDASSLCG